MWEPPRPAGGHGSGPFRPRPEFHWGGSVGLPKAAPPSLLGQIKPIRAQTTIRWRDRTFRSPRDRAGGHGSDPLCPLFDLGRVVAPGGFKLPHRPLGGQTATETLKRQSTVDRRRVRAAGGRRGWYEYSNNNTKIDSISLIAINCNRYLGCLKMTNTNDNVPLKPHPLVQYMNGGGWGSSVSGP